MFNKFFKKMFFNEENELNLKPFLFTLTLSLLAGYFGFKIYSNLIEGTGSYMNFNWGITSEEESNLNLSEHEELQYMTREEYLKDLEDMRLQMEDNLQNETNLAELENKIRGEIKESLMFENLKKDIERIEREFNERQNSQLDLIESMTIDELRIVEERIRNSNDFDTRGSREQYRNILSTLGEQIEDELEDGDFDFRERTALQNELSNIKQRENRLGNYEESETQSTIKNNEIIEERQKSRDEILNNRERELENVIRDVDSSSQDIRQAQEEKMDLNVQRENLEILKNDIKNADNIEEKKMLVEEYMVAHENALEKTSENIRRDLSKVEESSTSFENNRKNLEKISKEQEDIELTREELIKNFSEENQISPSDLNIYEEELNSLLKIEETLEEVRKEREIEKQREEIDKQREEPIEKDQDSKDQLKKDELERRESELVGELSKHNLSRADRARLQDELNQTRNELSQTIDFGFDNQSRPYQSTNNFINPQIEVFSSRTIVSNYRRGNSANIVSNNIEKEISDYSVVKGIKSGTLITGRLLTGLVSLDNGMPAYVELEENIFYENRLVIPRGSVISGVARPDFGAKKIFVELDRLIIGEREININAYAVKDDGTPGFVSEFVDPRRKLYWFNLLTSMAQSLLSLQPREQRNLIDQYGNVTPVDVENSFFNRGLDAADEGLSSWRDLIIEGTRNQQEIIYVDNNEKVNVFIQERIPLEHLTN